MSDRRLWRRTARQVRSEVEEEIGFHVEARAAALERKGMSPEQARAEAMRMFGDVDETLVTCVTSDLRRDRRAERRELLADVVQDARLGIRQLSRRPAFALVCMLTLGIAIGAAASIYAIADHVLVRPLPYDDPDRIVTLWEVSPEGGRIEVSPGNFADWRERSTSFSSMGVAEPYSMDLQEGGAPQAIPSWSVTDGYFAALGVRPVLGRAFTADEYATGARVALISYAAWQQRFGGDASVVGRVITLDGSGVEIVGVLPPHLEYPTVEELWSPKAFRPEELQDRRSSYMHAVARLAPGVTVAAAQAEMDVIAGRMSAEHPANRARGIAVIVLGDHVLGEARPAMLALVIATALLLLIACANLTNLLISRGLDRGSELAVRTALGAGRRRLVRQLVTESIVVSIAGGILGVALAYWGIQALVALAPADLPRLSAVAFNGRVVSFLIAITITSAALFGGIPALRLSRSDPMGALRGGRMAPQQMHEGIRRGVVSAEIAFCFVLLIGAGLLTRSLVTLLDNDLGFETAGRAETQIFIWDRNPSAEQRIVRVRDLIERLESIPGVQHAAAVSALPFHPHAINATGGFLIEGAPPGPDDAGRRVFTTVATPGYFDLMGIRLVEGRAFTDADDAATTPVVIINEEIARAYFPGESPIGRRVTGGVMAGPVTREIIGVVASVRPRAFDSDPQPELFVPHAQNPTGSVTLVAQGTGPATALLESMREAVWGIDPGQTVYHQATLDQLVGGTLAQRRFQLILTIAFGSIALALVLLGVYGVVSLWARERRREIGVRVALGASHVDIMTMVLGQGVRIALPGVLVGLLLSFILSRGLTHLLYGVEPTDGATFTLAAAVLIAAAAAAAGLPAHAAMRLDPAQTIRQD